MAEWMVLKIVKNGTHWNKVDRSVQALGNNHGQLELMHLEDLLLDCSLVEKLATQRKSVLPDSEQ